VLEAVCILAGGGAPGLAGRLGLSLHEIGDGDHSHRRWHTEENFGKFTYSKFGNFSLSSAAPLPTANRAANRQRAVSLCLSSPCLRASCSRHASPASRRAAHETEAPTPPTWQTRAEGQKVSSCCRVVPQHSTHQPTKYPRGNQPTHHHSSWTKPSHWLPERAPVPQ
jgi:hypothetical protein